MIVTNRVEHSEALKEASGSLARIMYSSAYCSHHDPEFRDIINFEEFNEVFSKITKWSVDFEKKLIEVELKNDIK